MKLPLRVGAVLYPGFEMLDTFGPLEMYSALGKDRVEIITIAQNPGPVAAALGADGPLAPSVVAQYGFDSAPAVDVLLLPGGFGTFAELENPEMITYLQRASAAAQITTSVCTGSALLARAGLLDGLEATSNKQFFSLARMQSDKVRWIEAARWVDAGHMVTSSGVSAGMDMTLAVIARLFSREVALQMASFAEYVWHEDPAADPFVGELDHGSRALGLVS